MPDVRVVACRAEPDYQVWLRFDDGLQGRISMAGLLDIGAFRMLRDPDQFVRVGVDYEQRTIVWEAGVRLDPEVLYLELVKTGHRPPVRERCKPKPISTEAIARIAEDREYRRFRREFLGRVLAGVKRAQARRKPKGKRKP